MLAFFAAHGVAPKTIGGVAPAALEASSEPMARSALPRSLRIRDSRSAARRGSAARRASMRRTAWSTVVWSRPPKRRPISGRDLVVSCFASHMAAWRGRATARVRAWDMRSACLSPKCSEAAFWISSTVIRRSPPRKCGRIRHWASSRLSPLTRVPAHMIRVLSAPSSSRTLSPKRSARKARTSDADRR